MAKKPQEPKANKVDQILRKRITTSRGNVLGRDVHAPRWVRAIGEYFKGAWFELRQVKWPTRKATWSFTLAVIVFTLVMSGFILALDYGFEQLFKKVIL